MELAALSQRLWRTLSEGHVPLRPPTSSDGGSRLPANQSPAPGHMPAHPRVSSGEPAARADGGLLGCGRRRVPAVEPPPAPR